MKGTEILERIAGLKGHLEDWDVLEINDVEDLEYIRQSTIDDLIFLHGAIKKHVRIGNF